MPDIKISELTAPIAVTDSDILPAVQSGVTRKITWGALKSTLSGALGRAYLGLGTAAVANLTTSAIDATAGRVMKVGDFGLGVASDVVPAWPSGNMDDCTGAATGLYRTLIGTTGVPAGLSQACTVFFQIRTYVPGASFQVSQTFIGHDSGVVGTRVSYGGGSVAAPIWQPVSFSWASRTTNSITVDTGSLGYGAGSGGTVTQATSKSTAVTLNKPSGRITTAATAVAANSSVSFLLNNSKIAATDIVLVTTVSVAGAGSYRCEAWGVGAGIVYISIENVTAGSLSDTININFVVIKGATA